MAKGPGIKKDERIYGASLVDIAPTILTLYGLPVGEDMDGRPLVEIFEDPPEVKKIPSWEEVPGDFGAVTPGERMSGRRVRRTDAAIRRPGLHRRSGPRQGKAGGLAEIEAKYNLARNYQWQKKADQAIPLLEEMVRRASWETRFITQLATAYHEAGYLRQAVRLAGSRLSTSISTPDAARPIGLGAWPRSTWASSTRG